MFCFVLFFSKLHKHSINFVVQFRRIRKHVPFPKTHWVDIQVSLRIIHLKKQILITAFAHLRFLSTCNSLLRMVCLFWQVHKRNFNFGVQFRWVHRPAVSFQTV